MSHLCLKYAFKERKRQKETRRDNLFRWRWYICTTEASGEGSTSLMRPLHNTPSAASLSRFGLGHVRKHTPFALTLSSLHLGYSAKSLPKKLCFSAKDHFSKVFLCVTADRFRIKKSLPVGLRIGSMCVYVGVRAWRPAP